MNICETRTRKENWGFITRRLLEMWIDMPHEPKSEQRFTMALAPHSPGYAHTGAIGDYAECKHCGSVYVVDAPQDSSEEKTK